MQAKTQKEEGAIPRICFKKFLDYETRNEHMLV